MMAAVWKSEHKRPGERSDLTSAQRRAEVDPKEGVTRAEAVALFKVPRRRSRCDSASDRFPT